MLDTVRILDAEWVDYELLDSGERQKLERFGHCMVIRPEPKAWWSPLRPDLWDRAHARFVDKGSNDSHWEFSGKFSPPVLEYGKIKFSTKFMDGSKHLGVFPELEDQLTSYVPGHFAGSPDRMDALVWAITELLRSSGRGERWITA